MVCMGRAVAHLAPPFAGFSDPTASLLLPERAQARVALAGAPTRPRGLRANVDRSYLRRHSALMALRTAAIDEVVRSAAAPQVVILGAGLDGRAWRLPELAGSVVFEVDHPDSQRNKRAHLGSLAPTAREIRFLAVDFARDSLDAALAQAGHDPAERTMWVWEGVVMYLTPENVEATLGVIARRSAPGSRLSISYMAPAPIMRIVGLVVRLLGEPFRSVFTREAMAALLARCGFRVLRDDSISELGVQRSTALGEAAKVAPHFRIAAAERT